MLVKVAILDTGIDLNHPVFKDFIARDQIGGFYDFINESSIPVDDNGHGTHVSHLLLKTAPYSRIYVARVFEDTEADDGTALLVAKVRPGRQEHLTQHVF